MYRVLLTPSGKRVCAVEFETVEGALAARAWFVRFSTMPLFRFDGPDVGEGLREIVRAKLY